MSTPEYAQPRDPSLALCHICERAYISKMRVPDYGNDGQIREYRTCALFVTGDCNDYTPRKGIAEGN